MTRLRRRGLSAPLRLSLPLKTHRPTHLPDRTTGFLLTALSETAPTIDSSANTRSIFNEQSDRVLT